jgi:hypothetical protein
VFKRSFPVSKQSTWSSDSLCISWYVYYIRVHISFCLILWQICQLQCHSVRYNDYSSAKNLYVFMKQVCVFGQFSFSVSSLMHVFYLNMTLQIRRKLFCVSLCYSILWLSFSNSKPTCIRKVFAGKASEILQSPIEYLHSERGLYRILEDVQGD